MLGLGYVIILKLLPKLLLLRRSLIAIFYFLTFLLNKPDLCRVAIETYCQISDGLDYDGVLISCIVVVVLIIIFIFFVNIT